LTAAEPAAVAAAYDFSQFETIIDVGGPTGNLLTSILGRHLAWRTQGWANTGPSGSVGEEVGGGVRSDARQLNDAKTTVGTQNSTAEATGSLPFTIGFPHFALSTKIQTSSGPPPVDPLIAHDQADPGARDLWIGQVDILPDQPRALAMHINQPSARSMIPVE
jgi:hypothetical protein